MNKGNENLGVSWGGCGAQVKSSGISGCASAGPITLNCKKDEGRTKATPKASTEKTVKREKGMEYMTFLSGCGNRVQQSQLGRLEKNTPERKTRGGSSDFYRFKKVHKSI